MILFKVNTHFQLINAINLKITNYNDECADLFLDDTTDFSEVIPQIIKQNIFRKVYSLQIENVIKSFLKMSREQKVYFTTHIGESARDIADIDVEYDSCFFGLDNISNKLFYYFLLTQQVKAPSVWVLEEGATTFVRDIIKSARSDSIPHEEFGDKSFVRKFQGLFLYHPELYGIENCQYPLYPIPAISQELNKVLLNIYGEKDVPVEKYIYFEDPVLKGRAPTNDIEVLNYITSLVGKENIAVKLHPRTEIDRFSSIGFKVLPKCNYPWEITLLTKDISDKVLLSAFSTASYTGKYMLGKEYQAIHLYNLYNTNDLLYTYSAFSVFYKKLYKFLNRDQTMLFLPRTFAQLEEIIKYIKGREKGNNYES